ncbi:MAG: hypothetical protein KAG61_01805 [Bacteriovoracaceae bacterium]|nr:hypothetical protein [Bacteriovoracaceae bacterium]
MKIFIFALLLSLHFNIMALELQPLIDQISKSSSFGAPVTGASCNLTFEKSFEERCAIELCGESKYSIPTNISEDNYGKYVKKSILKQYESRVPKVRKMGQAMIEDAKSFQSLFQKAILNDTNGVTFESWGSKNYDDTAIKKFDGYYSIAMDPSKELNERVSITIDSHKIEAAPDSFKLGLKSFVSAMKAKIKGDVCAAFEMGYHTKDEGVKRLRIYYESINKVFFERLMNEKDYMVENQQDIIEFFNNTKVDNTTNPDQFIRIACSLKYYNELIVFQKNGVEAKEEFELCPNNGCRKAIRDMVRMTDYSSLLKKLNEYLKDNTLLDHKVKECRGAVASHALIDYEQGRVEAEVPQILSNLLQGPMRSMSSESKKSFKNFVKNDLKFISGSGQSKDREMELLNYIDQEYIDMFPKRGALYQFWTLGDFALKFQDYMTGDSREFNVLGILDRCTYDIGADGIIWDYYRRDTNVIAISMFSDLHLGSGKSITAHEIGHSLSYFAGDNHLSISSNRSYNKIRKCVVNGHKYEVPFDEFYAEEDMADIISYLSVNDGEVSSCVLLQASDDRQNYKNLTLKNVYQFDPHSASLLRVLREAIYKNIPLGLACSQLVQSNKGDFRFKKCIE